MTVADIITECRAIIQQTDPNNSSVSDASILGWINACTRQLCSYLNAVPKVSLTGVTAGATITLSANLIKLDYASIADAAGKKHPLYTIDFANFARINPEWENAPTGKPECLVRMTDLVWKVWPAPDATWTGKTLTLIGSTIPADLTTTTEEPGVNITLHPCFAHYCSWKAFQVLNNPERAAAEYGVFDSLRKINTHTATNTGGSLLSFKIRGM